MSESLTCPSCGTVCAPAHRFCPSCGFPMEKLRDQAQDPLIGCTLPGGHVVLELIDVGGMGRVYRAEQKMLGRTVAVKIIHPHLLGDETVEARFITEARAASQLNHPNSVGVIDFGKFDGRLYMVMEYLRGRDLATVAHEEGPLEIDRIVDIMLQILAALEEAHHIGIVHRDLKPENVMLSPLRSGGDFVKVLDFGLAKVLEIAQSRDRRVTDPGMVCGTPEYMAPEQARGELIDHRVDLYACGVLLYELLAGQLPFDGNSPREIVLMHLSKIPPDIRKIAGNRAIPQMLCDIVYKAMSKSPAERFQSAREFGHTLKHALEPAAPRRQKEDTLQQCPACGAMMPQAQKFCGECGQQLSKVRSDRPPAAPSKPRSKTGLPLPLAGRKDEIAWLFSRRAEVEDGSVAAVTLSGLPGMGKSRLLREFLTQAETRGDRVVSVGPDPWWAELGFYALRRAIVELAGLADDGGDPGEWQAASPEARAGLDKIFDREPRSEAPRRSWTATPPDPLEGGTRVLAAEALRWALGRAQDGGGRVILAVDDLHAVDGASRNAFRDIVSEPPLAPVLLVAAHVPSFDPGWSEAATLEVKGLPTTLAAKLMQGEQPARMEDDGSASSASGRVAPMYLEQLLRYSREGGEDPPPKLADLIALRIERLDADARRVLQAVAVLGDAARSAQLVALLPDMSDIGRFMTLLRQAGFVEVNGPEAGCSHPLVRDIVLTSTPAAVRGELHGRARRDFGVDDLQIPLEAHALHAYYADSSFEALMLLEQTADRALWRDDPEGAVRAFRLALEVARREMMRGELDDPIAAVIMFSCKLGDALVLAGKHHDAEGVLTEALGVAGPQAKERPRLLASLANVARGVGRPGEAYAYLDEALRVAEKSRQSELVDTLEQIRQRWVAG